RDDMPPATAFVGVLAAGQSGGWFMTEQGPREGSPQTVYRDFPANLQLFVAIRRGDSAAIVDVLERHPDLVNAEERRSIQERRAAGVLRAGHATALVRAAERDDLDTVRLLIERGADVDQRCLSGESPLWVAVAARCPAVVRLLAEHGADVNHRAFAGNA